MKQARKARHLLLGGSGFIGRHVALALLQHGEEVVVADRVPLPDLPEELQARPSFVSCDFPAADWTQLVRDGDVVHHYVWSTIPKTANDDPAGDLDLNVRGTVRMLESLRERREVRVIFPSSGGTVYGLLRQTPVSEDHPLDPITVYGVSKLAVEKYLGFYRAIRQIDCRIARLSNPYGVGQNPQGGQGAATTFFHQAVSNEPIEVWGDGSIVRDYIHISDAVRGLLALADAEPVSHRERMIFNIGTGHGVSINEILGWLQEHVHRKLSVSYTPYRDFDVPVNVLDITRAAQGLDWSPKLSFADGMNLMLQDYKSGATSYSTLRSN